MGYAKNKTIVVDINKETGEISSETFGYVGAQCIEDMEKLMADLAALTSDDSKPERWQNELAKKSAVEVKREI